MPLANNRRLLFDGNDTAAPLPYRCVHHLFEVHAAATPDATAVLFGDEILTYGELNARSNQLAQALIGLGVVPDAPVAIALERSFEMIVALLAVLKAGGAYVPLAPEYPAERLAFMIEDSGARILITRHALRQRLPQTVEHTLCLDAESAVITQRPTTNPNCPVSPDHLAYVIYTSGSTGKPKGVLIQHHSVVRLVKNTNYVGITPSDVFLQLAPISFDAATFEIWGALLNGASLVVFPPHTPDVEELGAFLRRHGITTLWLTAALFHLMVDQQIKSLSGVRQILAGGDVLSASHVRKLLPSLSQGHVLINGYGPTENTTFTCCHRMDATTVINHHVPIGKPINNTQVFILDQHIHPVPVGSPGELYIGGAGLARGYLNRPELTAEKFIANPFSDEPGVRLYKTGDLARYRPDGAIEFLGRIDHQVKIRGFRIEPGEIETALTAHPGVREAVVIAQSEEGGDKRLVAYVVPTAVPWPTSGELRSFLRASLPDYMTPSAFVFLDALPHTPNGKVDRKALPQPDTSAGREDPTGDSHANPGNLLELHLLRLWRKAIGHSDFGVHANFFSMGGHSLTAASLAVEIEQLIGHPVPIASFFQAQTVASFAELLRSRHDEPPWSSLVPLQPHGDRLPLFVVHGWGGDLFAYVHLAQTLAPERPVYGLQAVGLDGKTPRHSSIDAMAAHYSAQIRSLQPSGPYHLIGYSLGGWIAYAVADHILRQGGTIGLLAALDTHATANVHKWLIFDEWLQWGYKLMGRIPFHVGKLLRSPESGRIAHLKRCFDSQRVYLRRILRKPRTAPNPGAITNTTDTFLVAAEDRLSGTDYFCAVHENYRPPRINQSVHLFTTTNTKISTLLFWYYYARRGVHIHRLFQDHDDFWKPHNAQPLASVLRRLLDEVETESMRP